MNWAMVVPPAMLAAANVVVNIAWYGHLKSPDRSIWLAIALSWALALVEYALVVPAVRAGSAVYTLPELKTIQLFMSAVTFVLVAWYLFGQRPSVWQAGGFGLIVAGAAMVFSGR